MSTTIRKLERRYLWTWAACMAPQVLWLAFLVWFIVEAA